MKVCVVGAGPCGLTTIKQLLDEGHEVVCYDKNRDLGGIWLRDEEDGHKTKAFDNLFLTISMKLMAYSDFPFDGGRIFYSRSQYFQYLKEYADHYQLCENIRFDSEVENVEKRDGRWAVSVNQDGIRSEENFDAVAICSGPFKSPNRSIPELESFSGEVVHSSEYRNNERFRGKKVLVVGLAESGADIVREISDVASACTLSIRSYTFLLSRITQRNKSTDHGTVRAHHHEMYRRATNIPFSFNSFWGRNFLAKAIFLSFSVVYGVAATAFGRFRNTSPERPDESTTNPLGEPIDPPKIDIGTLSTAENWNLIRTWNRRSHPEGNWSQRGIFCKNVSFIPGIVSGRVTLNDSGIERSDGNCVTFQDTATAEFDTIMLCTGYTSNALTIGDLKVKDGNVRNLYRHFLHPEHRGTVAFIGFVRPFSGGIPICAEMQARYFARGLSGKLSLPKNLDEAIKREKAWEDHWTALSPRHTESIPSQILYLDALAYELGCLVPMWKLLINPRLFVHLWFGSFNPSEYRIVGPHNRGAKALAEVLSEPVENRRQIAFRYSLLQMAPWFVHPKNMI
ncbi:SidA/IucD/PvdA family monooxygenase [Agrobacterium vitis]|uniref:flavin-containing monooxygenase n=1 Tax=Rhizobium/Agrobacterium group TaxID=227290 RepID=UPI0012E97916|nr:MULTISPECIES: NAD(P)-binding domain-containing protein [Rhizobium/Agrobacterium group]MCF1495769.1 dimethylaniline monooxygenase [Allorhizobium ampelinum]MVA45796.1 SidA/IucD/PvdA family monooxygenase [Agrobacterium vitis]